MDKLLNKKIEAFAPGRIEICGNHLDHQHGLTIAGTIKNGIKAKVKFNNFNVIYVDSYKYDSFVIDINQISYKEKYRRIEPYTSKAIVYGVACEFLKRGIKLSGLNVKVTSDLPSGIGLSSSAAFEMLFAEIFNTAFNNSIFSKEELAKIAYTAEVNYYGKPCGLLDQSAVAYGRISKIYFTSKNELKVSPLNFSLNEAGISVVMVDCGKNHHVKKKLFNSIPGDMKKAAKFYKVPYLKNLKINKFCEKVYDLDKKIGNKASLKSIHFFHAQNIVDQCLKAMENKDSNFMLNLHNMLGASSGMYLQNVIIDETNQQAALCLGICDLVLDIISKSNYKNRGACRIHGGGFGGYIEVFLPNEQKKKFISKINKIYKKHVTNDIEMCDIGSYAKFIE